MQTTAELSARKLIEKDIARFEELTMDQAEAIQIMLEEITAREALRDEYAGVVAVLRRSLNRWGEGA